MHNEPIEHETRLVQTIAAAYAQLPAPERERLDAIEYRLSAALPRGGATHRVSVRFSWLIVGLAAASAAAWWAGERWFAPDPAMDVLAPASTVPHTAPALPKPGNVVEPAAEGTNRDSRTIYRRERR